MRQLIIMRTVVTVLAIACILMIIVSIGIMREAWYRYRLSSGQNHDRVVAAERLVELKSLRAVPLMLKVIEADEKEEAWWNGVYMYVAYSTNMAKYSEWYEFTPIAYCVFQMGPQAIDAITAELEVLDTSSKSGARAAAVLSALTEQLEALRAGQKVSVKRRELYDVSSDQKP